MYNYIHIPFCRQKCLYCKFALTSRWQTIQIERYLKFLEKEISDSFSSRHAEFISASFENREILKRVQDDKKTQSIYFGGGTPSILSPEQIMRIIDGFKSMQEFLPDIEITLEANPEDITEEFVRGIRWTGVNRLSLGVQTLNLKSLQTIGRTNELFAMKALDILKQERFPNVNVDFILGLPRVMPGEIQTDIVRLLDTYDCIKHVSVYMLEDEKYPISWKEVSLPQEEYEKDFLSIRDMLMSRGFSHYELSNFAKKGFESRHNQAYWMHENYRGFGLSAASHIDGNRFTNSGSFDAYYRGEKIDEESLTPEQKNLEEMMFLFRTFRGVPENRIVNTGKLHQFLQEEYLRKEGDTIFLNSTGIFLIDYIMSELL